MRGRWWYAVLGALLAQGCGTVVMLVDPGAAGVERTLSDVFALVFLIGYVTLPVTIALDCRRIRGTVPWRPSATRWALATIIPVLAIGPGLAYLIRRRAAVRETVPGPVWHAGVFAGVGVWTGAFAIEIALDVVVLPALVTPVFDALLLGGLCLIPAVLYLDVGHVRGYADWAPNPVSWPLGAAIPYVGALVCIAYLIRRHRAAWPDRTAPTLTDPTTPGPDQATSPWFRGTIAIYVVYVVLALAVGMVAGPDVSDGALELAVVIVWIPFGPVFAAGVYGDARWRRRRDRSVGEHWYLYVPAALVPAGAFWYLLRRATRDTGGESSVGSTPTEND